MANPVENIITHPPTSPLEKTIIYPPSSPTAEIMDPEDIKLLQAIKAMGIKPKTDTPQDFERSMKEYFRQKEEFDDTKPHSLTLPPDVRPKEKIQPTSYQPPKINIFTGSGNKSESTYELWRYDIECLLRDKSIHKDTIHTAIRRSLRGQAGAVVMRLGPEASIEDLLHKLDSIYGNAANRVDILKELYGAEQRNDEDVISWSCRLEDIMGRAKDMGAIHPSEVKRMLHDILWNGLRKELKDASGHKYDSIKDFDSLRVAIRQIEMKHTLEQQLYEKEKKSKPNPAKAAQVTPITTEKSDIEELKGIVQQLVSKVDSYDCERQQTSGSYRGPHRGYQQGYRGTYRPPRQNYQSRQQPQQPQSNTQQQTTEQQHSKYQHASIYEEPQCFRCGQYGHYKRGCAVKLDHSKRGLNFKKPMTRGRY